MLENQLQLNIEFLTWLTPDIAPDFITGYDWNFINFTSFDGRNQGLIISWIDQLADIDDLDNLENLTAIYHYSVPNAKLSYPEPFIASASFMHTDLWFVHILIYQYWLWFVFIFIIVFFFVTFICTVRWCNMRVRPRRETRGVSRSKCGDLITAIVPVSWAASIIINESTDAIDYYDGFATTEIVVGIRAYQWGWEYYYPKDIDLNYNIKNNYSIFVGNSLKYNKSSKTTLSSNNLWKFYQNKPSDQVILPAYLLLIPTDNYKLANFLNFNDIGANSLLESSAFRRVRAFSKKPLLNFERTFLSYENVLPAYQSLYLYNEVLNASLYYGSRRQQNFISSNSMSGYTPTLFNNNSVEKFLNFNLHQKSFNNLSRYFSLIKNISRSYFDQLASSDILHGNFNTILNLNNNTEKKINIIWFIN